MALPSSRPQNQHGKKDGSLAAASAGPNRRIRVSKAMSWLLRHGAQKEGVAMDSQGYVAVSDLLNWHKMQRELNAGFDEVMEEVKVNEKRRFGLLYIGQPDQRDDDDAGTGQDGEVSTAPIAKEESQSKSRMEEPDSSNALPNGDQAAGPALPQSTDSPDSTTHALQTALSPHPTTRDTNPSHYLIRAVQGHSISSLTHTTYLTLLTPSNPSQIPTTVVHGTFHRAWHSILRSGGLKSMGRNHVHFATGPSLSAVLGREHGSDSRKVEVETVGAEISPNKAVISGMRSTAEILIYIDIQKALTATATAESEIPFWRSENGVILSEGVELQRADDNNKDDGGGVVTSGGTGRGSAQQRTDKVNKMVPMSCWDVVVEVKRGLGVIWRHGEVVREIGGVEKMDNQERNRKKKREKKESKRKANDEGKESEGGAAGGEEEMGESHGQ